MCVCVCVCGIYCRSYVTGVLFGFESGNCCVYTTSSPPSLGQHREHSHIPRNNNNNNKTFEQTHTKTTDVRAHIKRFHLICIIWCEPAAIGRSHNTHKKHTRVLMVRSIAAAANGRQHAHRTAPHREVINRIANSVRRTRTRSLSTAKGCDVLPSEWTTHGRFASKSNGAHRPVESETQWPFFGA